MKVSPKIIICIDGTCNDPADETNVWKMQNAIKSMQDQQHVTYLDGVGNKGWADALLAGGPSGWGISKQIRTAYREIVAHYKNGRQVWLFGFSRGAYAARSLSGFLNLVGVLDVRLLPDKSPYTHDQAGQDQLIEDAYNYYRLPETPGNYWDNKVRRKAFGFRCRRDMVINDDPFGAILRQAANPDYTLLGEDETPRPGIPVEFLGVWDSVGSLGPPGILVHRGLRPMFSFHDTAVAPNVTHAYHALALHEVRRHFSPDLWTFQHAQNINQVVMQKWFAGSHSNIGGSDHNRNLSNTTLYWMAQKAQGCGLELKPTFVHDIQQFKPDYKLPVEFIREKWYWKIFSAQIRLGISLSSRKTYAKNIQDQIYRHESVAMTWNRDMPEPQTRNNRHQDIDALSRQLKECQSRQTRLRNQVQAQMPADHSGGPIVDFKEGHVCIGDQCLPVDEPTQD